MPHRPPRSFSDDEGDGLAGSKDTSLLGRGKWLFPIPKPLKPALDMLLLSHSRLILTSTSTSTNRWQTKMRATRIKEAGTLWTGCCLWVQEYLPTHALANRYATGINDRLWASRFYGSDSNSRALTARMMDVGIMEEEFVVEGVTQDEHWVDCRYPATSSPYPHLQVQEAPSYISSADMNCKALFLALAESGGNRSTKPKKEVDISVSSCELNYKGRELGSGRMRNPWVAVEGRSFECSSSDIPFEVTCSPGKAAGESAHIAQTRLMDIMFVRVALMMKRKRRKPQAGETLRDIRFLIRTMLRFWVNIRGG
ncbi:hypothetical protein DL96DRAFT_1688270 [Flagelloscypha sp. PMI_526]|nr:hypothetical protein DL96DRAFT_1688270 [Flagelloscypha sp. PMI_526]